MHKGEKKKKPNAQGRKKPNYAYDSLQISATSVESNLEVIIDRSMKMSAQCSVAFKKANQTLGKKWRPKQKIS